MSFNIITNTQAQGVLFNMGINQNAMQKAQNQLSSGYKINSAADDAAGLAIATKMSNQVTGLNRATQNAQDGLSMLQTMEGGISSVEDMLGRMRDLALEASNGTSTGSDRTQIVQELQQLRQEITRTAKTTDFNTQNLLTGRASTYGFTFQVGANASTTQLISLKANGADLTASGAVTGSNGLGVTSANIANIGNASSIGLQTQAASTLVATLDSAISSVSKFRANVGAVEDRLNFAIQNLQVESNNLSAAKSRIMDTNVAQTMTDFSKNQILVNAGISMLAQANQMPGMVMKLLG